MKKEIREILVGNKDIEDVILDMEQEQEQLFKKLHVLKSVAFAEKVESLVKENLFAPYSILSLTISSYYYQDEGLSFSLSFQRDGSNKITLQEDYYRNKSTLDSMLSRFDGSYSYVSKELESYVDKKTVQFELKEGIGQQILNAFLDNELRTSYNFDKMDIIIPEQRDNKSIKKHKV